MFNCINGAGLRVPERCHFPMKLGTFEQASSSFDLRHAGKEPHIVFVCAMSLPSSF